MAGRTGTHDIASLAATRLNTTALEYGLDRLRDAVDAELEAHNAIMRQNVAELAIVTTTRRTVYGAQQQGKAYRVDEYGRAPTQRPFAHAEVGFPLYKWQYNVGWTREWEEERDVQDYAIATQSAETTHRIEITNEIKRAIFGSANYNHGDFLVDEVTIPVKRLVNADGANIPPGPNGETFDGATHTHYLASATLTTTAVDSLISTVVEHGHGADVRIYIAQGNETAFRGLTGFQAYTDPRLILGTQANQPAIRLDITRLNNRAIGIYGAATVWVKPWIPTNYAFCFSAGDSRKPIGLRERRDGSMNLVRKATVDLHPLHVEFMEWKVGAGVWTRTNGAVLYFAGVSYVDTAQ